MEISDIKVKLTADADGINRALDECEERLKKILERGGSGTVVLDLQMVKQEGGYRLELNVEPCE